MPLRFILSFLHGLTFIFTVAGVLFIAPYLETRYWPVVGKMTIEEMHSVGPDKTSVFASFTKYRACDYIGIAWFRGSREKGFVRVPLELMRQPGDVSSPNRPVGTQSSGPWIVHIPMREIEQGSFVELYHQCTPLWVSTTEFYP